MTASAQTRIATGVPRIDRARLLTRIAALAAVGAIDGGGVARLALTDADRDGRDLVVSWMKALGLTVTVDAIGNVVGVRAGREDGPPVMTGSHIDTVRTGGRYDGNLGVLAGLEVVAALTSYCDDVSASADRVVDVIGPRTVAPVVSRCRAR